MDTLVHQIVADFKAAYGLKITDKADLFLTERNMLEYLMRLGRAAMGEVFAGMGKGYEGPTLQRQGGQYKFVGYRKTVLHGLFGLVDYSRAYYFNSEEQGGGYFPLDERLGIDKRHTPGCQYFLSTFTGREAYQKSLNRFHEIFRPDGQQHISMRKALDMDGELGSRIEALRQQEISGLAEEGPGVQKRNLITDVVAFSVDAAKVREKGEERTTAEGRKKYDVLWKDVKIAALSEVGWDPQRQEAFCTNSSYVSGIEHADEFFKRIHVEFARRVGNPKEVLTVVLADGAKWIWDRVGDIAPGKSLFILDFYHACEHVSEICKQLYGEQTLAYWKQFNRWKDLLYEGKAAKFILELRKIRDKAVYRAKRDYLQGELNYFQEHKDRMHYDRYRQMHLPIGSGTIESACKNVVGGRMKQGGMTWSQQGAEGMLQIRSSIESDRFLDDFLATLDPAA
jgi:hypothetical protein